MVNLVLRQKGVVNLAKKFHAVEIDASKIDKKLAKRYKLLVSPSVVFVDPDRSIIGMMKGKATTSKMLNYMKGALAKADKNKKAREKKAKRDAKKKAKAKTS